MKKLMIDYKELKKALKVLNTTILEENRMQDVLKGININYDGKVLCLQSTNTFSLNKVILNPLNGNSDIFDVTIKTFKLDSIKKVDYIILDVDNMIVSDPENKNKIALNCIDGYFPNTNNIINELNKNNFSLYLGVKELTNILKGMEKNSIVEIKFNNENIYKPFELIEIDKYTKNEYSNITTIISPCRVSGRI